MDERWSVFEANVQSYRSNMIASQSFLLAVAAGLMQHKILECACVIIALFQLWYIWFRIIRVRTIIVDYYFYKLYELTINEEEIQLLRKKNKKSNSKGKNTFLTVDIYVHNRAIRKEVNKKKHVKHNMRISRFKIDLLLPITFTILWILFFLCCVGVI